MSWKTTFNMEWTDKNLNLQFVDWIESVRNDPYKARCPLCLRAFSLISNMGRQAVSSHERSAKHQKIVKNSNQPTLLSCLSSRSDTRRNEISIVESDAVTRDRKNNSSILNFVSKDEVLKSEIVWAMKLVMAHSSYNGFKDIGEIFKVMFPDSEICKKMTLSSSKMAYLVAFGLSPYFQKELLSEVGKSTKFVLCMDEAMNTVSQRGQMDLIIRYWPEGCNEVQVRFWNSVFLGHSTAQDLCEKFFEGSRDLDLANLLQFSIDGPNVNLKFLRSIKEEIKETKGYILIDIGTCSLHIIHNAFQTGNKITKWKLNEIFSSMYLIFKDSPARRADFIALTETDLFPLKFCKVRWVENVKVAERALEVFANVKKYFNEYKANLPHNFSIGNIENACGDNLILAKIAFFISMASMLEPYLKMFQSPKPMVPFMYGSIAEFMTKIMLRFVRREIITEAKTPRKLFEIDVSLKKNHLTHSYIDISVAARSYIARSGATDLEKTVFLNECKNFFIELSKKILEKFKMNFPTLRALAYLNPSLIKSSPIMSEKRMDSLLQILHENNHLSAVSADRAKQQFGKFADKAKLEFKEGFSTFSESKTRLDVFFHSLLSDNEEFKDLWSVVRLVLTLSHGNASVESGFSINKDILVENLEETSLIALRRTYDAVKSKGGVTSVTITSEMLQYAKLSRHRYHQGLEEKKQSTEKEKKMVNERKRMRDRIKVLQQKKARLSNDMALQSQKLNEEIVELEKNLKDK